MAQLTALLAWATPVHPVQVCAHLQAYINLQPIIQTLRTCYRVGKDEDVVITRLPVEMVGMIENHLMQEHRRTELATWSEGYRCWVSGCRTVDHFPVELQRELFHDLGRCGSHCEEDHPCECGRKPAAFNCQCEEDEACGRVGLSEEQLADLETATEHLEGDPEVMEEHDARRAIWDLRFEYSSRDWKDTLLEHFGLELWTSQSQVHQTKPHQRSSDGMVWTSLAYLCLPDAPIFGFGFEPEEPTVTTLRTQVGFGMIVAPPPRPSEASLKRFPRAMRVLGLTTPALETIGSGMENGSGDIDGKRDRDAETHNHTDPSMPQLRLLACSEIFAD